MLLRATAPALESRKGLEFMNGENIISWTPANWITVVLMVAIAFTLAGFGAKVWQMKRGSTAAA